MNTFFLLKLKLLASLINSSLGSEASMEATMELEMCLDCLDPVDLSQLSKSLAFSKP